MRLTKGGGGCEAKISSDPKPGRRFCGHHCRLPDLGHQGHLGCSSYGITLVLAASDTRAAGELAVICMARRKNVPLEVVSYQWSTAFLGTMATISRLTREWLSVPPPPSL